MPNPPTTQQHTERAALLAHVHAIAQDVGRLRRHPACAGSLEHLADRLAQAVDSLDAILQPSAAELARLYFQISGDHNLAVQEALRATERAADRIARVTAPPEPMVDLRAVA